MKRLLLKTFLFLIPLAVAGASLEFLLRKIPNDYSYKREYLDKHSNEIEILFLGSSHAYYGINPKYVSGKGFNAGYVSQSIDYDYRILEKYKNEWKELKFILVPLDYLTLFYKLSIGEESWRVKNYHNYYKLFDSKGGDLKNLEIFSGKSSLNLQRIYSYYYKDVSLITCSYLGFGDLKEEKMNLQQSGKAAAKLHTFKGPSLYEENLEILEQIVVFAAQNHIQIILYTSPANSAYVEYLDEKQLNLSIETAKLIAEKNSNCFYYNFLEDSTFGKEDYNDANHLNEKGAKKFSMILDKILKEKGEKELR